MIASYLTAERELGRITADADVDTLAPTLVGAGHLLFADREGSPPEAGAVRKMVTTVIASVVQEDRRHEPPGSPALHVQVCKARSAAQPDRPSTTRSPCVVCGPCPGLQRPESFAVKLGRCDGCREEGWWPKIPLRS